jgi:hypothetical protein
MRREHHGIPAPGRPLQAWKTPSPLGRQVFSVWYSCVGASIVSRPNWPVGVGAATVLLGYALAWIIDFAAFDSYDDAGEMIAAASSSDPSHSHSA